MATHHRSVGLTEDFHCYLWQGRGNNCNSALIANVLRGEHPHVLIDPGHTMDELREPCFDSLVQAMAGDGYRVEDVGLVIATHCHPDHYEATQDVVDRSGALVTMSREEYEFYQGMGKQFYGAFGSKAPEVEPAFFLKEGDLNLGSKDRIEMEVVLTPGHTPGSVCLYLKKEKILVGGDVVFHGSIGRVDFPGGSAVSLRSSLDRLSQLEIEYLVPGHSTDRAGVLSGKDNVARNFQMVKMFL